MANIQGDDVAPGVLFLARGFVFVAVIAAALEVGKPSPDFFESTPPVTQEEARALGI